MFSKFELTNDGVNLLNRVIAEKKTLKFTKFQLGKGDYEGDKKVLSQLVDKFDEFNITQTNVLADGITNIRGFYDNRNLSVASKLTEIGIMAQLGDDNLTEVLFSYSNQPSAEAETIPAKESYFSRTFSVMNKTDNVTSVTFDLTIRQDKYNFGTLEEMKSADYLDVGDKVTLWGETELGDTPFRMYIITDEVQDTQLINTLYAKEYFSVYDGVDSTSTTKVASARAIKIAYDKGVEGVNKANTKLDAGSVSAEYNTAKKIEDKIKAKIDKTAIVNDLTTGGADKVLSGEMGKKLNGDKMGKKDAISSLGNNNSVEEGIDLDTNKRPFTFYAQSSNNKPSVVGGVMVDLRNSNGNFGGKIVVDLYDRMLYKCINPAYNFPWREIIHTRHKELLGISGITATYPIYIQDIGTKEKNKGYIDKDTGRIYKALERIEDVTVTDKFEPIDNVSKSYPREYTLNGWNVREYKDTFELMRTIEFAYSTPTQTFNLPKNVGTSALVLVGQPDLINDVSFSAIASNTSLSIKKRGGGSFGANYVSVKIIANNI